MECVSEFVGETAARGLMDEGFEGSDERAVTGEPDRIVGPQAGIVEADGFTEGIVAPAVGVTLLSWAGSRRQSCWTTPRSTRRSQRLSL